MAKAKKTLGAKAIADISHPGTSAPSDTSKPIITPRPIIKDPMVVGAEGNEAPKDEPEKPSLKRAGETRIDPLVTKDDAEPKAKTETKDKDGSDTADGPDKADQADQVDQADHAEKIDIKTDAAEADNDTEQPDAKVDVPEAGDSSDTKDKASDKPADKSDGKDAGNDADTKKEEAQAAQDAELQKLIDTKKYFLPINAVEHRRSARFVAIGVILALILAAAWVDVALDAGLIHLSGIKPVTHLFSN